MKKQIIFLISLLFLLSGMSACGRQPQEPAVKGTQSRLKHTKKDSIQTIMSRKIANIDYIMYGFINYDEQKIEKGTNNLIEINNFIKDKMPRRRLLTIQIWNDLRNKQIELSRKLAADFRLDLRKEVFEQSRETFKQLVANCMECHRLIRHQ